MQGGFQRAGKQRPDGTQIPARRHPPSRVCRAWLLICSREGFSLRRTSAAAPGRHPGSLTGILCHLPGWVPASGVRVLLRHGGAGRPRCPLCHQRGDRGLISYSQGISMMPRSPPPRPKGLGGLRSPAVLGSGWQDGPSGPTGPLCYGARAEGLLLAPPSRAEAVAGQGRAAGSGCQACPGTRAGTPHTQPRSAVPAGCSRLRLRDPLLAHPARPSPATPGKPAPFPNPRGKLRHWDVQDRSRDAEGKPSAAREG